MISANLKDYIEHGSTDEMKMTMDLCSGHVEHIMTSGCTDVNPRSKGNTIMMICTPVEQTQWWTVAVMITRNMAIAAPN
jgi:hypothetical protein